MSARPAPDARPPMTRPPLSTPAFIVGCRRSGTTLVSRIIDAHSAFSIYHESFLYPIFSKELRWYGDLGDARNLDRLIDDVREVLGTQVPDVPSRAEIRSAMSQASLSGVFGALLHLYARGKDKRRGGDKTPEHHRFLPEILRDFGGSPVVFTMRDPRDTVQSIRRVFDTSVAGAAHRWRQAWECYEAHRNQVYLLRYEALVLDPETEVRRLSDVLGEAFEPEMLEFHRHTPDSFRNRLGGEKLQAPIDKSSIGQFRSMPESDIRIIEAVCAGGMEALGYEFAAGRPSFSATPAAPRETAFRRIADALRYYGLKPQRWKRGAARWKVMLRLRLHWLRRSLVR